MTGVIARTFTRRTDPPELRAISTAVLIAGFARSVSARSTGTKILLYMTAHLVSLQGCNHHMFSWARYVLVMASSGARRQRLGRDEALQPPGLRMQFCPVVECEIDDHPTASRHFLPQA